jgi:hypothetical protein
MHLVKQRDCLSREAGSIPVVPALGKAIRLATEPVSKTVCPERGLRVRLPPFPLLLLGD